MKEANVNIDQWVDMFRAIGLDEEQMSTWHGEFERRHPDAHEGFLHWLNLSAQRINDIRARAAARV